MSDYLIINAYGDLIATFDSFKDASNYLMRIDNEDLKGYHIEIVNNDGDDND